MATREKVFSLEYLPNVSLTDRDQIITLAAQCLPKDFSRKRVAQSVNHHLALLKGSTPWRSAFRYNLRA